MQTTISKLLDLAGDSIGELSGGAEFMEHFAAWGRLGSEVVELLVRSNGFFAYESSLLFRPLSRVNSVLGIQEWNAQDLWKAHYKDDLSDALFFGEDAFGGQFCLKEDAVQLFDPETGMFEALASSLEDWAGCILVDCDYRTGFPLAHEWQTRNGPIPPGMRLLPKVPFVCGGEYEVDNLYLLNDVEGMRFRGGIASQIRDVPDGSQIVLNT